MNKFLFPSHPWILFIFALVVSFATVPSSKAGDEDPYVRLGVDRNATDSEILSAYRKKVDEIRRPIAERYRMTNDDVYSKSWDPKASINELEHKIYAAVAQDYRFSPLLEAYEKIKTASDRRRYAGIPEPLSRSARTFPLLRSLFPASEKTDPKRIKEIFETRLKRNPKDLLNILLFDPNSADLNEEISLDEETHLRSFLTALDDILVDEWGKARVLPPEAAAFAELLTPIFANVEETALSRKATSFLARFRLWNKNLVEASFRFYGRAPRMAEAFLTLIAKEENPEHLAFIASLLAMNEVERKVPSREWLNAYEAEQIFALLEEKSPSVMPAIVSALHPIIVSGEHSSIYLGVLDLQLKYADSTETKRAAFLTILNKLEKEQFDDLSFGEISKLLTFIKSHGNDFPNELERLKKVIQRIFSRTGAEPARGFSLVAKQIREFSEQDSEWKPLAEKADEIIVRERRAQFKFWNLKMIMDFIERREEGEIRNEAISVFTTRLHEFLRGIPREDEIDIFKLADDLEKMKNPPAEIAHYLEVLGFSLRDIELKILVFERLSDIYRAHPDVLTKVIALDQKLKIGLCRDLSSHLKP